MTRGEWEILAVGDLKRGIPKISGLSPARPLLLGVHPDHLGRAGCRRPGDPGLVAGIGHGPASGAAAEDAYRGAALSGRPPAEQAREVWIIASGAEKADAVALVLSSAGPIQVPAAGARGRQRTLFLLDSDAAAKVPPQIGRQGAH